MSDTYLEINDLSKHFPGFTLNHINFQLPRGYIMGLVGPNGSGKTTTIQLILNLLVRDSGAITVFGKDNIVHEAGMKQELGIVFDNIFYSQGWTAKQVEKALSVFYTNWSHTVFRDMIERFELPLNKKIRALSRGMQTKLMLACAFSHDAKLLILDEPTSGLDPVIRDEFLEILQEFIKDGERSVLFSTHITTDLERIADYITFLNHGEVFYTGSMDELMNSYRLIKGRPQDLFPELEAKIIGLRKTERGFEGLIKAADAEKNYRYLYEPASVEDIIVCASRKGERRYEELFKSRKA